MVAARHIYRLMETAEADIGSIKLRLRRPRLEGVESKVQSAKCKVQRLSGR